MATSADLLVTRGGTLCLLHPTSRRGQRWLAEHIADDAQQLGAAGAVEPRYIGGTIGGAIGDGLRVR